MSRAPIAEAQPFLAVLPSVAQPRPVAPEPLWPAPPMPPQLLETLSCLVPNHSRFFPEVQSITEMIRASFLKSSSRLPVF